MFLEFIKFYLKQLRNKIWFLIGFLPAIFDYLSFWFDVKYPPNPIFQRLLAFKWEFLFFFLIITHIYIIYQAWKQPGSNVVQASLPDEELPYKQTEFTKVVDRILINNGASSSFADRYRNGFRHLSNESISLAASEYLAAFRQTEELFLNRNTYNGNPDKRLLSALGNSLNELRDFSDNSQNDGERLRRIISSLENVIGSLSAYIL